MSGIDAVDRIPANQGPTEGTNASLNGPDGDSLDRWWAASRSWMWSVSEYGLIAVRRDSGDWGYEMNRSGQLRTQALRVGWMET